MSNPLEYLSLKQSTLLTSEELDVYGNDEWDLVSFIHLSVERMFVYIFKRPAPQPDRWDRY